YATAFAVAPRLIVVPSSVLNNNVRRITLQTAGGDNIEADPKPLAQVDDLALLSIGQDVPFVPLGGDVLAGPVACGGCPVVSLCDAAAEPISGSRAAPTASWLVRLDDNPRLSGAPLFQGNQLVGVPLATRQTDPDRTPAVGIAQVHNLLAAANQAPPA